MNYHRTYPEMTRAEAMELGLPTIVLGHSQVSLMSVPDHPEEVYILNWITDREHRGQGHARLLFHYVLWLADASDATLVVHPDDEGLCERAQRWGFEIDASRGEWESKPLLVRLPRATMADAYDPRWVDAKQYNFDPGEMA